MLGLFFDPEDGGDKSVDFEWTTRRYSPEYKTSEPSL
jgi:hypothetical protein